MKRLLSVFLLYLILTPNSVKSQCIDSTLINPFCVCPMIYAPVCGCDGIAYANDCLAQCDGNTLWGPVDPTLSPGMPCSFSSCEVEISGDSIICSWGSPQVLTASPTATSNPFISYVWSNGQSNSSILTITSPGNYCVTATDSAGCVSIACIDVSVQDIPIFTNPSPAEICHGDSIILEIDTIGLSSIIWIPNSIPTPPVHRIVDFPIFSQNYIVEAIDSAGCDRRGEVFVDVDSCNVNPCSVDINNGTIDIEICDGDTAILEATSGFNTYSWALNGSTGGLLGTSNIVNATNPGIYTVVATDSTNCVDIDSIEVIMYASIPLNPITFPDPPLICLGDTIVILVDFGFLDYWWNTGNPLDQGEDKVLVFPTQDFTYIVEAIDSNGCESREEIEVFVDTCATGIFDLATMDINIYPNPSNKDVLIDLPKNIDFHFVIFDITGKNIIYQDKVIDQFILNKEMLSPGSYILNFSNEKGVITRKLLIY